MTKKKIWAIYVVSILVVIGGILCMPYNFEESVGQDTFNASKEISPSAQTKIPVGLTHEFHSFQNKGYTFVVDYYSLDQYIAIFQKSYSHLPHGAGATIGALHAKYDEVTQRWSADVISYAITRAGEFGKMYETDIEFISLGHNKYGFFIFSETTFTGEKSRRQQLFGVTNERFYEFFNFLILYDVFSANPEGGGYSVGVTLFPRVNEKTGYTDFVVKQELKGNVPEDQYIELGYADLFKGRPEILYQYKNGKYIKKE